MSRKRKRKKKLKNEEEGGEKGIETNGWDIIVVVVL